MKWNKATTKLPEIGKRYMICEEGTDYWLEGYYFNGHGKYTVEGWYILIPKENGMEMTPLHDSGRIEKVWYTDPKIPARIKERM